MKALTIYQPWATLIVEGVKLYEFRKWDYSKRFPGIVGQRIAIHASARKATDAECANLYADIMDSLHDGKGPVGSLGTDNHALLTRALDIVTRAMQLPTSCVVGTAVIGKPETCLNLFRDRIDPDRIDPKMFGWPVTDVRQLKAQPPTRGFQGFWNIDLAEAA